MCESSLAHQYLLMSILMTSDAECELVVEFIVTTFSYPLSGQSLEFLTMIYQVVSGFSSFSACLEIYPESNVPLSKLVACPTRHPICPIFTSFEVMPRLCLLYCIFLLYMMISLDS